MSKLLVMVKLISKPTSILLETTYLIPESLMVLLVTSRNISEFVLRFL